MDAAQDQSESGCYCSDEELRMLLQKLPPPLSTSKGCLVGTGLEVESHELAVGKWDIQVPKLHDRLTCVNMTMQRRRVCFFCNQEVIDFEVMERMSVVA